MRAAKIVPAKLTARERLAALRASVETDAAQRPGVYRMLAEDGAVLYVGKSKRVRARLLSYFHCDRHEKGARLLRQTRRIEWEYTPSEFAALLLELRLIKRLRPPFNAANKRDLSYYAFLHLTTGPAPKLTVHRAAQGGTSGEGLYYGPFLGPERVVESARELSDALGLRDCADDVPMRFDDEPDLIPLGSRAPGCLRYEVKKCVGPCIAGCSAREYDDRVAVVRAFLEGRDDGPIERFRREMAQHAAALSYERAALYRDKIRRLERLRDQFAHIRFALESLSFVYPVPGFDGDDRVYLIRRGTVRAERAAPRNTPDRLELQRMIDQAFQPAESKGGPVRLHEVDEILMVSSWFRRNPEELARTWAPE